MKKTNTPVAALETSFLDALYAGNFETVLKIGKTLSAHYETNPIVDGDAADAFQDMIDRASYEVHGDYRGVA